MGEKTIVVITDISNRPYYYQWFLYGFMLMQKSGKIKLKYKTPIIQRMTMNVILWPLEKVLKKLHSLQRKFNPKCRSLFKGYVEQLAHEKGRDKDLSLYTRIERMAPQLIAQERKIFKGVSPNVDFYSGFVYDMLGIPQELYTAMFAVARIVGWSAHRIEELICMDKIIRPAYMSVMEERE